MSLSVGTKLGPYVIGAPLGAGGMGEVYRAKDTRLDRTVAIKVLPGHAADNLEQRQRLDREARAIATLTHPHICTLYDVGHQDGIDYLVMEYLEGETLAARLTKGPLPLDQVLKYAIEIADALDKAHRAGIVHRDLKPGNVMLTKSGAARQGLLQAKLLDFGLAKTIERVGLQRGPVVTDIVTSPASLTAKGMILGTLQYMAPEQLEGKEADGRTDIFALGTVIYEMATGQKAFTGQSQASLIAAILDATPPAISTLQPLTPASLDQIVRRCLAKDPDERWQSAADLHAALGWVGEGVSIETPVAPITRRRYERVAWMTLTALLVVALIWGGVLRRPIPQEQALMRVSLLDPEDVVPYVDEDEPPMISPDGRLLAFVALPATKPWNQALLWVRRLDSLTAEPLAGTEGASFPFWSADGRFVGFFANKQLQTIEVSGGPPQVVCGVSDEVWGGSWNQDSVIVFAQAGSMGGLFRVSASGGAPVRLKPDAPERSHRFPRFLPDGHHFLVVAHNAVSNASDVYVESLDSKDLKLLMHGAPSVQFAAPGYLIFGRQGVLRAQRFDPATLTLSGDAVTIEQRFSGSTFSVSQSGALVYRAGVDGRFRLAWFNRSGVEVEAIDVAGFDPWFSFDDKRLVFEREDQRGLGSDIWLFDVARKILTRLTTDAISYSNRGLWSPDGTRIVFQSVSDNTAGLYEQTSNGAGAPQLLLSGDFRPIDWSTDGRYMILSHPGPGSQSQLDTWVLPQFGERKPFPLFQNRFNEAHAHLSPDMRWIAYDSDESGGWEVYVQPFPKGGAKVRISVSGGAQPAWRRDGKEMFYLAADKKIMAVDVKGGSSGFEAAIPHALFQTRDPLGLSSGRNHYAVTGDGQRFVVIAPPAGTKPTDMSTTTLVLNWPAALNQ